MNKIITSIVMIITLAFAGMTVVAVSNAGSATASEVCVGLSSGKIDTTGDPQTVTITAPTGSLITQYCVKAGSSKQGDGPVYVDVVPPVPSLTISHPSGKAISHYSFAFTTTPVDEPTETPTDTPTDTPTETPTDVPTEVPTDIPTEEPTDTPTDVPTDNPTTPETPTETPEPPVVNPPTDNPPTNNPPLTSPNPNGPVETKTRRQYTCEFLITYFYEKQNGRFVEVDKTKERIENKCAPGEKKPNLKEEGL